MKHFLPLFLLSLSLLFGAYSCQKEQANSALNFGTERYDSAALHLALVPNRDCCPVSPSLAAPRRSPSRLNSERSSWRRTWCSSCPKRLLEMSWFQFMSLRFCSPCRQAVEAVWVVVAKLLDISPFFAFLIIKKYINGWNLLILQMLC